MKFNGMLVDTNTLGSATQAASFNAVEGSSVVFVLAVTLVAFVEFFSFRARRYSLVTVRNHR